MQRSFGLIRKGGVDIASRAMTRNTGAHMVTVAPVLDRVERFEDLLATDPDDPAFAVIRTAETTGRPLATADFIQGLERVLGRPIARRAPGRKPAGRAQEGPLLL